MLTRTLFIVASLFMFSCGTEDATNNNTGDDAGTTDVFQVEFHTTQGDFVMEANRAWSRRGADRFRALVEAGFYDGCRFFRVVPGFMVQFGVNGDPTTNAMWSNNPISDDAVTQSNTRGYVTFAATQFANSRTTQLFINFGNNAFLDAQNFAPFARVISGMDVVDGINAEYGESPNQQQIATEGNAYLDASFPNLDHIISARIL